MAFNILTLLTLNASGFNKGLQDATQKVNTFSKKSKQSFGGLSGEIKNLLPTVTIGLLIDKIGQFGKVSYEAFEEQEKANRRLLFAVNGNVEAFQRLSGVATELQAKTGIDETFITQIEMLAVKAGYSSEMVDKLTRASVELSSLLQVDLTTAYKMLAKTLDGTSGKLGTLDIDINTLTKDQLKNGEAIDIILQKHEGLAESSASVKDKMKKNWGEIQESVGGALAKVINPALEQFNDDLQALNELDYTWYEKLAYFLPNFNKSEIYAYEAAKEFNKEIKVQTNNIIEAYKEFTGYNSVLRAYSDWTNKINNKPKTPKTPKPKELNEQQKIEKEISELNDKLINQLAKGNNIEAQKTAHLINQKKELIEQLELKRQIALATDKEIKHIQGNYNIPPLENKYGGKSGISLLQNQYNKNVFSADQFNDENLKRINEQLKKTQTLANLASNAIQSLGDAFISMAEGGEASFKSMVIGVLDGIRSIVTGLLVEAMMGQLSENSKLGLPGLALAAVGITAVEAMFAAMPKFAYGGIVAGSSFSGDKLTVRANSGEMILNHRQQANLFELANKGFSGGEVRFEIEGTRLVGVLNNYNKKISNSR